MNFLIRLKCPGHPILSKDYILYFSTFSHLGCFLITQISFPRFGPPSNSRKPRFSTWRLVIRDSRLILTISERLWRKWRKMPRTPMKWGYVSWRMFPLPYIHNTVTHLSQRRCSVFLVGSFQPYHSPPRQYCLPVLRTFDNHGLRANGTDAEWKDRWNRIRLRQGTHVLDTCLQSWYLNVFRP